MARGLFFYLNTENRVLRGNAGSYVSPGPYSGIVNSLIEKADLLK